MLDGNTLGQTRTGSTEIVNVHDARHIVAKKMRVFVDSVGMSQPSSCKESRKSTVTQSRECDLEEERYWGMAVIDYDLEGRVLYSAMPWTQQAICQH